MNKYELLKINLDKKQIDKKAEEDKNMINRTQETSSRPPMVYLDLKGGGAGDGEGELRGGCDPVLLSSLDDLVALYL